MNGLAAVSKQLAVIIMTGRKPIEWPSLLNLSCKFNAIIKDCIIWPFVGKNLMKTWRGKPRFERTIIKEKKNGYKSGNGRYNC